MSAEWVKFSLGRQGYETGKALQQLSYLVVMEVEFNIDTQEWEVAVRNAGWKDT